MKIFQAWNNEPHEEQPIGIFSDLETAKAACLDEPFDEYLLVEVYELDPDTRKFNMTHFYGYAGGEWWAYYPKKGAEEMNLDEARERIERMKKGFFQDGDLWWLFDHVDALHAELERLKAEKGAGE
jgi:hypothetical protein